MTSRVLPPSEWPRLSGTLLERVWPSLDPATSRVVVVEQGGVIVGTAALFQEWHFEGAWIAPERRADVSVGRHLLRAARHVVGEVGATEVWMMATDDAGKRLCQGLGPAVHMDCDHYAVQMRVP